MDAFNQVLKTSAGMANDAYRGVAYYFIGKDLEPLVPKPAKALPAAVVQSNSLGLMVKIFGNASPWIRVAGLSGAIAVSMGAYGAHGKITKLQLTSLFADTYSDVF